MRHSTGGRGRRPVGRRVTTACWCLAALGVSACSAEAPTASTTPAGTAWRESLYENFALELSAGEAECLAGNVRDLTRMVGPLVGQRPDDTATSVWAAVDRCLQPVTQGDLARAIVLGGWSGEEPSLAGVWNTADEALLACVQTAGGWTSLGSYTALMATCGGAGGEVQQ